MSTKEIRIVTLQLEARRFIALAEAETAAGNREITQGDGWLSDHHGAALAYFSEAKQCIDAIYNHLQP